MKCKAFILSVLTLVGIARGQAPADHSSGGREVIADLKPWDCDVDDEIKRAALTQTASILAAKLFIEMAHLRLQLRGSSPFKATGEIVYDPGPRAQRLAALIGWHDWLSSTRYSNDFVAGVSRVALVTPVAGALLYPQVRARLTSPLRAIRVPARSLAILAVSYVGTVLSGKEISSYAFGLAPATLPPEKERALQTEVAAALNDELEQLSLILNWSAADRKKVSDRLVQHVIRNAISEVKQRRSMGELKTRLVVKEFEEINLREFLESEIKADASFPIKPFELEGLKEMERVHTVAERVNKRPQTTEQKAYALGGNSYDKETAVKNARGLIAFIQTVEKIESEYKAKGIHPNRGGVWGDIHFLIGDIREICRSDSAFKEER